MNPTWKPRDERQIFASAGASGLFPKATDSNFARQEEALKQNERHAALEVAKRRRKVVEQKHNVDGEIERLKMLQMTNRLPALRNVNSRLAELERMSTGLQQNLGMK